MARVNGRDLRRVARAEAPFLSVLVVLAAAPAYLAAAPGHWLRGAGIVAIACLLAAALRLLLSDRRAGSLVVRRKWWDVTCYTTLGVVIIVTGVLLPG